jgi:hypothetical protein
MLYANDGASPRQTMDPAARHSLSEAVWIDLLDPTDAERAAAERLTGLRVPSREDIAEIESSSRIYTEGNVLYLSMSYSYLGADGLSHASPVGFVLSGGHLLTLRFAELPAFETYARQFSHNAARQPRRSSIDRRTRWSMSRWRSTSCRRPPSAARTAATSAASAAPIASCAASLTGSVNAGIRWATCATA